MPQWPTPGEQQKVDSGAPGDGDEREKDLLPESEHGPPIECLEDLLEAPEPKEWVSEERSRKRKIRLGRGS